MSKVKVKGQGQMSPKFNHLYGSLIFTPSYINLLLAICQFFVWTDRQTV